MFTKFNNNKVVEYTTVSKGQSFTGRAVCSPNDSNNLIIGERLAQCRCDLQIRKRDLQEIRRAKEILKEIMKQLPVWQSKLYMTWFQEACEKEKNQLEHMRNLKDQIKNLSNGVIINQDPNK